MGAVGYDVPMVTQEANPICWVACMAMVESYHRGYSIGIDKFTGFDPSNSSIQNPARNMPAVYRGLTRNGFRLLKINPKIADLEKALTDNGPLILCHTCKGFPYGPKRTPITDANARHAVVLTGIDTEHGVCWMNNPWGDIDQDIRISAVIYSLKAWDSVGMKALVAYGP